MSRPRRAKQSRAKAKPAKPEDPVWEIVKAMHLPAIELRSILNALFFMGYGMCEHGRDDGETIYTLARRAREQLEIIDDGVIDLIQLTRD